MTVPDETKLIEQLKAKNIDIEELTQLVLDDPQKINEAIHSYKYRQKAQKYGGGHAGAAGSRCDVLPFIGR